jgi:uncharacterized protein (TIGR00369 family)
MLAPMFPDDPIYDEPVRGAYPELGLIGLPGIDRVGARGREVIPRPPIHHLFGLMPVEAGYGYSVFTMPASPWLETHAGVYFAGVSALVNDAPLGSSILSTVPPGVFGATSELSMNFLRPAGVASRQLIARSEIISVGRTLGLSQATVTDANDNVLSHSTSRYFLQRIDPPPDPIPEGVVVDVPSYDTPDPHQRPVPPGIVMAREAWEHLSGLEFFRAVIKDELPQAPFLQLFGARTLSAEEGRLSVSLPATGWLTSPARTIYGGVLAFLADITMTGALTTTLPPGHSVATLDLKVQYLRPGLPDGRDIICNAEVNHRGRSMGITRCDILNADGKQIAIATGSSMVLARPWSEVTVADEPAGED